MQSEWVLCLWSRPPACSTLVPQVTFTPGKPRLLQQITVTPGRFAADPVLATHSLRRSFRLHCERPRDCLSGCAERSVLSRRQLRETSGFASGAQHPIDACSDLL